jgi:phosphatidylglycerol:prolipoprotein diacylglycerol transferase
MIYHNINPVLLKLWIFQVNYYNLVYILGILFTYFYLRHLVKGNRIKSITLGNLEDLLIYLVVGLIAGARILYFVFYSPLTFVNDPLEIFRLWHGGMSFHGGLIGLAVALLLFSKKFKVGFYDIADNVVIPASIILFFGRIANFINGEAIGTVKNLPFCIQYKDVAGCRHPSQIYEALKNLLIFFVLLSVQRKKKLKPGILFWLFVLLYGSLRFLVTFFRDDPRILGLSTGQYLCLAMVVCSVVFLYRIKKKKEV